MLAPRKPIPSTTGPTSKKERARRPLIQPLGFSLRLNLWYTAFFVAGAVLLFSLAYILLVREFRELDREIVRAKLVACRAWYLQGGPAALQQYFQSESGWEKESTFLEVMSSTDELKFFHSPQRDEATLTHLGAGRVARDTDWLSLPSSEQHMVWTIARAPLPDGGPR
jgi:hypothetical protein